MKRDQLFSKYTILAAELYIFVKRKTKLSPIINGQDKVCCYFGVKDIIMVYFKENIALISTE